jgi:hypothetical protein
METSADPISFERRFSAARSDEFIDLRIDLNVVTPGAMSVSASEKLSATNRQLLIRATPTGLYRCRLSHIRTRRHRRTIFL